ncbi:MAG TPA: tail fiber domain-containing protein [Candidatus Paceibacterota bacterium]
MKRLIFQLKYAVAASLLILAPYLAAAQATERPLTFFQKLRCAVNPLLLVLAAPEYCHAAPDAAAEPSEEDAGFFSTILRTTDKNAETESRAEPPAAGGPVLDQDPIDEPGVIHTTNTVYRTDPNAVTRQELEARLLAFRLALPVAVTNTGFVSPSYGSYSYTNPPPNLASIEYVNSRVAEGYSQLSARVTDLENSSATSSTSSQWADVSGGISYASGNVGIGTANPNEMLVVGDDLGNITASATTIVVGNTSGLDAGLALGSGTTTRSWYEWIASGNYLRWGIYEGGTVYQNNLVLKKGMVGINNNNPESELSVRGTIAQAGIRIQTNGPHGTSYVDFGNVGTYNAGSVYYNNLNNSLGFKTNSVADRMTINSSGNVGIGTTTPGSRLVVAGDIAATGTISALNLRSVSDNTFVGNSAGISNVTGNWSTYIGAGAGMNNQSGNNNVYVGVSAGQNGTQGWDNVIVGAGAGVSNMGWENVFLGHNSGYSNTSGTQNTFTGRQSGYSNMTGVYNAFYGAAAGRSNISGSLNAFFGPGAGQFNVVGSSNTAVGNRAGYYNASGTQNAILGEDAGRSATNNSYTGNALFGYRSGYGLLTGGDYNTLLGYQAGSNVTTGARNIIIGYNATATSATVSDFLNIGNSIYGNLSTRNIGIGTSTPSERLSVVGNANISGELNIGGASGTGLKLYVDSTAQNIQSFDLKPLYINPYGNSVVLVPNGDNVGVGAVNPTAKLTVKGTSASGDIFSVASSSNASFLTVTAAGNVGIGTGTPGQRLSVAGSVQSTALLGGSTNLTVDANGVIIRDPSDQKLKQNIATIENALEKVSQLRGVSYEWIDKARFGASSEIGVIAQEVEQVVPEVVSSGGAYKSVKIANLVGLLIEAVKEMKAGADAMLAQVASLADSVTTKLMSADKVKTDVLCVGQTCVTESQLQALLLNSNIQQNLPQAAAPSDAGPSEEENGGDGTAPDEQGAASEESGDDAQAGTGESITDAAGADEIALPEIPAETPAIDDPVL